jgi:GNAT superfamily N-acetyltransferase
MTLQIRSVSPSDYDSIITVVDAWWGGRQMATMLPKLFFKHFQETSFVAEIDGEPVGFLIGFLSATYPDEAYIHFAGVHPDYRKVGIGRLLYTRFFEVVYKKERKVVRCVTSPVNVNSIAFHRQMGFEIEPSTKQSGDIPIHRNYDGPGEDRVLFKMKLDSA